MRLDYSPLDSPYMHISTITSDYDNDRVLHLIKKLSDEDIKRYKEKIERIKVVLRDCYNEQIKKKNNTNNELNNELARIRKISKKY